MGDPQSVARLEEVGFDGNIAPRGAAVELIPAIDLLGGRVVRLSKGDYDAVTEYGDDPVEVARGFAADGAERIHIVDLDAAREAADAGTEERRGGRRPSRVAGAYVLTRDGEPLLYVERGGKGINVSDQ